jgi:hypothetical protein
VKTGVLLIVAGVVSLGLSSCFLITVPMKATGEIVEKSAYATRDIGSRGLRKLREPAEPNPETYNDPGAGRAPDQGSKPDYGSDAYYED